MSYNVDTWKTKEISNLRIPFDSLYTHSREDFHPEQKDNEDGTTTWHSMDSEIRGNLVDGIISVLSIDASGEGSGRILSSVFEPALKESTGRLVAVRVWEGGDSIDRITVIDGQLNSEQIDL